MTTSIQSKSTSTSAIGNLSNDEKLNQEYNELLSPIKKRFKHVLAMNTVFFIGIYYFSRNINRISHKTFDKNSKMKRTLFLGFFGSFGIISVVVLINLMAFGVNPFRFIKKKREIEDKYLNFENTNHAITSINHMWNSEVGSIKLSKTH